MRTWTFLSDGTRRRFFALYATIVVLCFGACDYRDWPDNVSVTGNAGGIDVSLEPLSRATTSTITKEEADLFLVTVRKGEDMVSRQVLLGSVSDMSFPAGYGYRVYVENITETEAETLNDGWGAKRYDGTSKSFGIQAGQTTKVGVACTVANAAVSINMADDVMGCVVTITDGSRTLVTTESKVAYFNVIDDTREVTMVVEKDGRMVAEQTLSLKAAIIKDVNIKSETFPDEASLGLSITYSDTFDVVETDISLE